MILYIIYYFSYVEIGFEHNICHYSACFWPKDYDDLNITVQSPDEMEQWNRLVLKTDVIKTNKNRIVSTK